MNALKNLSHAAVLGLWAVAGVLLTTKVLFAADGPSGMALVGYWVWFGGLAALTSWVVGQFKASWAALAVHSAVFFILTALPNSMPFGALRLGLDLLHRA